MKCIIAGSRTITDFKLVEKAMREFEFEYGRVSEVVSGTARGADRLGELWAMINSVPIKRCPADWRAHGKAAGPLRNKQMAEYADAAVIFWDGESRGAKNMYDLATARGLKVQLTLYEEVV